MRNSQLDTTYESQEVRPQSKGAKIGISTIPDPGYQWENEKLTVRHHIREPRGQTSKHILTDSHKGIAHKRSTKEVPPWNGQ